MTAYFSPSPLDFYSFDFTSIKNNQNAPKNKHYEQLPAPSGGCFKTAALWGSLGGAGLVYNLCQIGRQLATSRWVQRGDFCPTEKLTLSGLSRGTKRNLVLDLLIGHSEGGLLPITLSGTARLSSLQLWGRLRKPTHPSFWSTTGAEKGPIWWDASEGTERKTARIFPPFFFSPAISPIYMLWSFEKRRTAVSVANRPLPTGFSITKGLARF